MSASIVFLDIAGPDRASLQTFYSTLFGWDAAAAEFSISVGTPLSAAIREDPAEKRLYIGVDDITAALEEVQALGGSVDKPRFEVLADASHHHEFGTRETGTPGAGRQYQDHGARAVVGSRVPAGVGRWAG